MSIFASESMRVRGYFLLILGTGLFYQVYRQSRLDLLRYIRF